MIEDRRIPNGAADVEGFQADERFVEYQEVVIGEPRKLHGLGTRAGVGDDVPMLLKHALQSPAHPIVAASKQGERRTFR